MQRVGDVDEGVGFSNMDKQQDSWSASKGALTRQLSKSQQDNLHQSQPCSYSYPQQHLKISLKLISQQLIEILYQIAKHHALHLSIEQINKRIIESHYFHKEYSHTFKVALKKRVYDIINILISVSSIVVEGKRYALSRESKTFAEKVSVELALKEINVCEKRIKQNQIVKRKQVLYDLVRHNKKRLAASSQLIYFPFFITLSTNESNLQYRRAEDHKFQIVSSDLIRIFGDIDSLILLEKINRLRE